MKKNVFSGIVLGLFFIYAIYLSGILGGIQFIFSFFIYGFLFYGIGFIWNKVFIKPIKTINEFLPYFAHRISILLIIIGGFFISFIYYENYFEPAMMPEFTISNGKKTVVFQGMAHIGSDNFYNRIKSNIIEDKNNGYVLFYEGVKPGSKESTEKFNSLIGFEFNKKTYVNMSKLYGLRAQNNLEFLHLVNDKDFNTDISMNEIIAKYEKKFGKIDPKKQYNKLASQDGPVKIDEVINEAVNSMTPRELELIVKINRALMNFIIKNDSVRDTILSTSGQGDLFGVILDDRNNTIVESINSSEQDKIHILYGLMHFNGVWSQLQRQDSNWKLLGIRYFKPIE